MLDRSGYIRSGGSADWEALIRSVVFDCDPDVCEETEGKDTDFDRPGVALSFDGVGILALAAPPKLFLWAKYPDGLLTALARLFCTAACVCVLGCCSVDLAPAACSFPTACFFAGAGST